MITLEPIAKGDLWPFPYFRLWETIFSGGRFKKQEIDIATDFTEIKFSSRHSDNQDDLNDHTKDDIYADMTIDSGGLVHYEWTSGDTDVIGRYQGRLVGIRNTGARPWHSKFWFEYWVVEQSHYGRKTS
ncbi:MAG: hypothetical protein OEM46_07735 [Ignavibacteria bacterium]|nr:hypothetical protein [Ignavibacteria bacterium]